MSKVSLFLVKKTLDDERRKRKELINNVAQQEDLIEGIVKKNYHLWYVCRCRRC